MISRNICCIFNFPHCETLSSFRTYSENILHIKQGQNSLTVKLRKYGCLRKLYSKCQDFGKKCTPAAIMEMSKENLQYKKWQRCQCFQLFSYLLPPKHFQLSYARWFDHFSRNFSKLWPKKLVTLSTFVISYVSTINQMRYA